MPYEHRVKGRVDGTQSKPKLPARLPCRRSASCHIRVPRRSHARVNVGLFCCWRPYFTGREPAFSSYGSQPPGCLARRLHAGKIVPIPPSQETVNTLFNANVHSEAEMEASLSPNPQPPRGRCCARRPRRVDALPPAAPSGGAAPASVHSSGSFAPVRSCGSQAHPHCPGRARAPPRPALPAFPPLRREEPAAGVAGGAPHRQGGWQLC